MFASSKLVPSKAIKISELKIAVVPGKQFNLQYHNLRDVYNCILDSISDSLQVLIYLPGQETPIQILGNNNKEKCVKLQNKLLELTA